MESKFVGHRKELTKPQMRCFAALAFNRSDRAARPLTALKSVPALGERSAFLKRVTAAIQPLPPGADLEKVAYAVAAGIEGPGSIPTLVSVRHAHELDFFECNIQTERGDPFTIESMVRLESFGLVSHAEWYEEWPEREFEVLVGYNHLTERGIEFCEMIFAEKMRELKEIEDGRRDRPA